MPKETIGYIPDIITSMPEVRSNLIKARFVPKLGKTDSILLQASDSQLNFIASVLS